MNGKILVTGVAGLLGANFARHLLEKDHTVLGFDDLSGGYKEYLPEHPNFCFEKTSIWNEDLLDVMFSHHNIEYVYHFAAYAAAGYSPFVRELNYTNNIMVSAALINTSIRTNIKKFIFASSMEVYGNQMPPFTEEDAGHGWPETPYGIAKLAIEMDLEAAYQFHGLEYAIVRPHNVHGIYQNIWDRYRNVIGIFIRKALAGEDLTVYGNGSQKRAFSDVDYYMEPFEKLMYAHSGHTFNIGADQPTTILELAQSVQKVAMEDGITIEIRHAEPRKEVHEAYCDHDKAEAMLGFKDGTDLEALIRKMYAWAKTQPVREVKKIRPEIEKGLYSYWK